MKIIDCKKQKESRMKTDGIRRSLAHLNLPFSKDQMRAQEMVVKSCENVLSDSFFLLCEIYLDDFENPIPFILVGPAGIWLFNISFEKGLYRANEKIWEVMDERTNHYKAAIPNLLTKTIAMGNALEGALDKWELEYPKIETILFFPNPGIHIDRSNPLVKIILVDSIDRFVASLPHKKAVLDKQQAERIADILSGKIFESSNTEIQDSFSFKELPSEKKHIRKPIIPSEFANVGRGEPAFVEEASRKLSITRRQWILLGLLLVFNIIILSILVIVLLLFT